VSLRSFLFVSALLFLLGVTAIVVVAGDVGEILYDRIQIWRVKELQAESCRRLPEETATEWTSVQNSTACQREIALKIERTLLNRGPRTQESENLRENARIGAEVFANLWSMNYEMRLKRSREREERRLKSLGNI